jgi:TrmH family RNA methyltransferase
MHIEHILSRNAAYQKFQVLKTNRNKRHKYGEFLVEGVRNINQAVKNGWIISSFIYSKEKELSGWAENIIKTVKTNVNYILSYQLLRELSDKTDTSELLAILKMKTTGINDIKLPDNPVIVLFDRPSNKGNLGALIRSCDALGASALLITGHCVDMYDTEVISASMGSFFTLPILRIDEKTMLESFINTLRKQCPGFMVIATTAHKKLSISNADFTRPCMLLVGNETGGLNNYLNQTADLSVTIPMAESSSASSLNVACAATAVLYEIARQRNENSNH